MLEVNGNTYPMTIDKQGYHPKFLQCGMEVYREYQRRLWDPNCKTEFPGYEAQCFKKSLAPSLKKKIATLLHYFSNFLEHCDI